MRQDLRRRTVPLTQLFRHHTIPYLPTQRLRVGDVHEVRSGEERKTGGAQELEDEG